MNPVTGKEFFQTPGELEFQGNMYPGVFPAKTLQRAEQFPFAKKDILIDTYPKSGTTWLQEIVYLITTKDFNTKETLNDRVPFMEMHWPGDIAEIDKLLGRKPPRIIKSHLPYQFLAHNLKDREQKIIIGMRNIKDVLVSFYHFYKMNRGLGPFHGSWDEFFEMFRHDKLTFGNYFDHVLGWWSQRHLANVHFVKFEDLKLDHSREIKKIANFLDKPLTEAELQKIVSATSFDCMKKNNLVNKAEVKVFRDNPGCFIRNGSVGGWKSHFTREQNDYVDQLLQEKLSGTGLEFTYE